MAPGPVHEVRRQGAPDGPVGGRRSPQCPGALAGHAGHPGAAGEWRQGPSAPRWAPASEDDVSRVGAGGAPVTIGLRVPSAALPGAPRGAVRRPGRQPDDAPSTRVSSAPAVDRGPVAAHVRDPALTGLRGAGIVVSCAQGALGLLPFAVRLGDLRVAGVHLLAIARHGGPEGGGAESRGATEFGPTSGRSREGRHARPRGPDGTSRPGREGPPAGLAPRYHQQSTTFESTTQRR
jgi:hypothetical protein